MFVDILCDIGMIDQLVGHLSEEHSATHEHVMGALLTVVTDHDRALQEAHKPHLNLVDLLTQRIDDIRSVPAFQVRSIAASVDLWCKRPTNVWSIKSVRFNVHIQSKWLYHTPIMGIHSSYELGCVSKTVG